MDELFEMQKGKNKHIYVLYRCKDVEWNMMKVVFLE